MGDSTALLSAGGGRLRLGGVALRSQFRFALEHGPGTLTKLKFDDEKQAAASASDRSPPLVYRA